MNTGKFCLFLLLFLTGCSNRISDNRQLENINKIKQAFNEWKTNEIKLRHFIHPDSCNWEYVSKLKIEGIQDLWSIPDSADINYSFADLNKDSIVDGLVYFCPSQCDGGNGSVWFRFQILIISNNDNYELSCYLTEGIYNLTGHSNKGFKFIDSIAENEIWGSFIEFKEGDGYCCPSTNIRFHQNYQEWKELFE